MTEVDQTLDELAVELGEAWRAFDEAKERHAVSSREDRDRLNAEQIAGKRYNALLEKITTKFPKVRV